MHLPLSTKDNDFVATSPYAGKLALGIKETGHDVTVVDLTKDEAAKLAVELATWATDTAAFRRLLLLLKVQFDAGEISREPGTANVDAANLLDQLCDFYEVK